MMSRNAGGTTVSCNRKSGNRLHKGQYRERLALHQIPAGNITHSILFIHPWNHYTTVNAISSSYVGCGYTHPLHDLKEYSQAYVGLTVTEINIKKVQKNETLKMYKVVGWHARKYANQGTSFQTSYTFLHYSSNSIFCTYRTYQLLVCCLQG